MNNFHGITRTVRKEGKIARIQAWNAEANKYHQLDFFVKKDTEGRDFAIYAIHNDKDVIELKNCDKGMEILIEISYSDTYKDKIFIDCCVRINQGEICGQKNIQVTEGYWRIGTKRKNGKIPY
jgi:hypothetical protein